MLARQAVQKSLVVLKNDDNVLPLSKTAKVALAGKQRRRTPATSAAAGRSPGRGRSGNVIPGATSVRAAMEAEIGASNVVYSANGSTTTGAAVAVAVIGETPYAEGKGDKHRPDASRREVVDGDGAEGGGACRSSSC